MAKKSELLKRWRRIAFITLPLLIVIYVAWQIWFYKYGTGEYEISPNGRYTAHLSRYYERTLWDGEIDYVRAKIVDTKTEEIVWKLEYKPDNTSNLYDYGIRGLKFIQWNAASTEVTFPLDTTGKQVVVPMP